MHRSLRIALTTLAAAGIAGGLSCAAAVPANAYTGTPISTTGPTGMCNDICLYYNSPSLGYGAIFKADGDIDDLAGYKFSANPGATQYGGNPNAGAGQYVKNNAAAAEDEAFYCVLDIYYNSKAYGYGNYDFLGPGYAGRLETTYNQDAAIGLSNCSS